MRVGFVTSSTSAVTNVNATYNLIKNNVAITVISEDYINASFVFKLPGNNRLIKLYRNLTGIYTYLRNMADTADIANYGYTGADYSGKNVDLYIENNVLFLMFNNYALLCSFIMSDNSVLVAAKFIDTIALYDDDNDTARTMADIQPIYKTQEGKYILYPACLYLGGQITTPRLITVYRFINTDNFTVGSIIYDGTFKYLVAATKVLIRVNI